MVRQTFGKLRHLESNVESVSSSFCPMCLQRLPCAEWDDPFETTFWSWGNLRLPALHGVVPRGTSRGPPRIRMKVLSSPELRLKGRVVHPGIVEVLVERTVHSCFASHGGSCACHNEQMRCRRPSLVICLHFFMTSILSVVPLRFLVPGLFSEARRHHSRGVDPFVGKKTIISRLGPGSWVRHPSSQP